MTLSNIKPSTYVLGTAPPVLKKDPGAGPWNSVPPTLGMKALKEALVNAGVQALASHFGGDDAVKHIEYYLANKGGAYTIDLPSLLREVSLAKQVYDLQVDTAKAFVETLLPGRHNFTSTTGSLNHAISQGLSRNWFFAVGSYTSWGSGVGVISSIGGTLSYSMDFEYHFFDRYNWDGGKQVQIPIPGYNSLPGAAKSLIDKLPNVSAGRLRVTDQFMGEFHRQGLAKEFDMVAILRKSYTWKPNFVSYKVRPGDTLSKIATLYYGDANKWRAIYNANKTTVPDSNTIRIGMELKIPL